MRLRTMFHLDSLEEQVPERFDIRTKSTKRLETIILKQTNLVKEPRLPVREKLKNVENWEVHDAIFEHSCGVHKLPEVSESPRRRRIKTEFFVKQEPVW